MKPFRLTSSRTIATKSIMYPPDESCVGIVSINFE